MKGKTTAIVLAAGQGKRTEGVGRGGIRPPAVERRAGDIYFHLRRYDPADPRGTRYPYALGDDRLSPAPRRPALL